MICYYYDQNPTEEVQPKFLKALLQVPCCGHKHEITLEFFLEICMQ